LELPQRRLAQPLLAALSPLKQQELDNQVRGRTSGRDG
jgi:hypothetical protein